MIDPEIYKSAQTADDTFWSALIRVYGKNACNARYWHNHEDPTVCAAAAEFRSASDRLRREFERDRRNGS